MGLSSYQPISRESIIYLPEKFKNNGCLTGQKYLDFFQCYDRENLERLNFPVEVLCKKIETYSKGMLQKLGLAFFFGQKKDLKIADEIMSGLDYKTRDAVKALINAQNKQGITFLFTTHTFEEAHHTTNRFLHLDKKNIHFDEASHKHLLPRKRCC